MSFTFKSKLPLYLLLALLLASCSTPLQEVIYMNGIESDLTYTNGPNPEEYRIRPNDQLYIQVISDDPLNAAFLNLTGVQSNASAGNSSNSMELITYLVNDEGKISYPYLGELEVQDKTIEEVMQMLQGRVDEYLESAAVFVKLVNRNITVIGEVQQPGQKLMVKNQLTIFEALGTAGDITDWGNRKNVKLIRETPEGKHVTELDMTDPEIIMSPYYYVLPHDIIYVEHRSKVFGAKNMRYAEPISIVSSLVSMTALILTLIISAK